MENLKDFNWLSYIMDVVIVSIIIWLFLSILNYSLNRFINSSVFHNKMNIFNDKKFFTLISMIKTLSKFLGFICIVIYILSPFIDLSKILAGAGVLGIILGFGAQSLIKDILTGFFLLFENQLNKGDFVKINNKYTGTVEEVGFRALKIREWGGNVLSISNGNIIEILNGNVEKRRVVEGILFSYNENPESIKKVLNDVCIELNDLLKTDLILDEENNPVEDFRIRGVMDLTSNRGGYEYTIVGLVKDENYFDCMYTAREILVKHIYNNNLKLIEDRVYIVDSKN